MRNALIKIAQSNSKSNVAKKVFKSIEGYKKDSKPDKRETGKKK